MTSTRTYRPAIPVTEAARRIRGGDGAQFTPHVVVAFEWALAGVSCSLRVMRGTHGHRRHEPMSLLHIADHLGERCGRAHAIDKAVERVLIRRSDTALQRLWYGPETRPDGLEQHRALPAQFPFLQSHPLPTCHRRHALFHLYPLQHPLNEALLLRRQRHKPLDQPKQLQH